MAFQRRLKGLVTTVSRLLERPFTGLYGVAFYRALWSGLMSDGPIRTLSDVWVLAGSDRGPPWAAHDRSLEQEFLKLLESPSVFLWGGWSERSRRDLNKALGALLGF